MGLNQKISLILSAEDKGGAAFNAFLNGITGIGRGSDLAAAKTLALSRNTDALASSYERAALASQKLARYQVDTQAIAAGGASFDKVTLAQQRHTLAMAQAQKVMDGYSASAKAFAKAEADLESTQSRLLKTQEALGRATAVANVAPGRVQRAQAAVTTAEAQRQVAYQKVAASPTMTPEAQLALTSAAEDKVAAAQAKVTTEVLAQRKAEEDVAAIEGRVIALYDKKIAQQEALNGLGQLQVDQGLEREAIEIRVAAAANAVKDAKIQQLALEHAVADEQRKQTALLAEQKTLSAKPSIMPLALTGISTAAAVAGFIGYKASKDALAFQSTEAQLAAQTNTPTAEMTQVGNAALQFLKSGKSQFSGPQLLQGTVLELATQLPASVIKQVLPEEAQVAGVFKQPDLSSIATAINAEIGFLGTGSKTTAATIKQNLQSFTLAEQNTRANPGDVINALPQLFSGLKGSGISSTDALGLESGLVNATGISPQRIATWLGQLVKNAILKPNPQAVTLANQIGLQGMFGQAGLEAFGNNPFTYLQKISDEVGTGPNRNQMIQQLLGGSLGGGGIVAARAFQNLTTGTTMQDSAALADKFAHASGVIGTATTRLLDGEQQKLIGTGHKLEKQFIDLGTAINQQAIPAIVAMALELSAGVDAIQKFATGLDDWVKHHDPTHLIPKQVRDAAGSVWDSIPGLLKPAALTSPAVDILTAPILAAKVIADRTGLTNSGAAHAVENAGGTFIRANGQMLGTLPNAINNLLIGQDTDIVTFADRIKAQQKAQQAAIQEAAAPPPPVLENAGGKGNLVFNTEMRSAEANRATEIAANTARDATVLQGKNVLTPLFQTNFQNFKNDVAGSLAGTNNMTVEQFADFGRKLIAEMHSTGVAANLTGKVMSADTATINADIIKVTNQKNLDAANIAYNNAVTQQALTSQETANLSANQAATEAVYQKQLALIQAQYQAGTLKGKDLATAQQGAVNTRNQGFLGDITAPLADAQAQLQLAINAGAGIAAAKNRVNSLISLQGSTQGGPTAAETQLSLEQSNVTALQGPLNDAQAALAQAQQSGIGIIKARNALVALLRKEAGPGFHGISQATLLADIAQIDVTDLQKPMQDAQDALALAVKTGIGIGAAQKKVADLLVKQAKATHASAASLALQQSSLDAQALSRPLAEAQAALSLAQNTGVGIGAAETSFLNISDRAAKDAGQGPNQVQLLHNQTKLQDIAKPLALAQDRLALLQKTGGNTAAAQATYFALLDQQAAIPGAPDKYAIQASKLDTQLQDLQGPYTEAQARLTLAQETGVGLAKAQADVAKFMNKIARLQGLGPASRQVQNDQQQLAELQTPLALAQARLTLAQQNGVGVAKATQALFALFAKEQAIPGGPSAAQSELNRRAVIAQNLQGPAADAQANLTLAQSTGFGLPAAEKQLADIYRQEAADHVISAAQLKLDLYQLHQSTYNVRTPGPQLIRPTLPTDDLTVSFMSSASRISSTAQSSVLEKQLAVLEAMHQADQRTIAWQAQEIKELRINGGHLASIDAKTPPPPKHHSSSGSNIPLASLRVS